MNPKKITLQQLGANCYECPLKDAPGPIVSEPANPLPGVPALAFVGERPGPVELGSGRAFAGDTGYFLNNTLTDLGLKREWVAINNALPCWDNLTSDADASKAVRCCSPRLRQETADAKVIVAMGDRALQSYLGFTGIWSWRGYPLEFLSSKGEKAWVFPVHHPTSVLREPNLLPIFHNDLLRAQAFANGDLPLYVWPPRLIDEDEITWGHLSGIKKRLDTGEKIRLSYDVENLPLGNIFTDPLLCHGIAWDVPTEVAVSLRYPAQDERFHLLFMSIITHKNAELVTQNGNHDAVVAQSKGYNLAPILHDTLQMARILYFQWPKKDLGTLASTLLWRPRHKSLFHVGDDRKGSKAFGRAPIRDLLLYNCGDNLTQLGCHRVMMAEMRLA